VALAPLLLSMPGRLLPVTEQAPRQDDVPDLSSYLDRAAITGMKNNVDAG
jgi:hypothetical protein